MLIRISYLFLIVTLALSAVLFVHFTQREADAPIRYVGVARCQSCHEPSHVGTQYKRWLDGPHAKAFAALESDSAKAYLASNRLSVESCLRCHTTLGRPAHNEAERTLNAEGVGCERCHGAGGAYAFYHIMKDRAAFTSNGGVVGTLGDCYRCHARDLSSNSIHCPFQRVDFDADTAWPQIQHSIPDTLAPTDTVRDLRTHG